MAHSKDLYIIENGKVKTVFIEPDKRINCGVETFFFPINSRRGLKVFADKRNAQNSLRRQTKAAKHGLGPKVFSKKVFQVIFPLGFDSLLSSNDIRRDLFDMFDKCIGYGYFTQIIEIVKSEKDYTEKEENELVKALYKLFPDVTLDDIHEDNVGRIKGKLVMVDFGDESAS